MTLETTWQKQHESGGKPGLVDPVRSDSSDFFTITNQGGIFLGKTIFRTISGNLLKFAIPYLEDLAEKVGMTAVLEVKSGKDSIVVVGLTSLLKCDVKSPVVTALKRTASQVSALNYHPESMMKYEKSEK